MKIPTPTTPRQVREFLGTAGFCRLWIPGFASLAAPLYPLTRENIPFTWTEKHQKAFDHIKEALLSAPALALPDLTKPFTLYVDERAGVARGVLTQTLGPWRRPVAYLSKKLDPVASGWPTCLKAVAAVALLLKDADKLTLGQNVTVIASHSLESIVRQPPNRWMTNARMTHYQSLLLNERISFAPPAVLNPATLLPVESESTPVHQCSEILAEEAGTRRGLKDQPLPGVPAWYTDGSSFIAEGKWRAGAAIVDGKRTVWASSLPEGTSAQKAELIALTQALRLAEGKNINIYTDSRYAFATAHIHGAIYKQRGLLTSAGKDIKNKQEILALLEAIHLPKQVAIIHCPGHQRGNNPVAAGNRRADEAAKQAALSVRVLAETIKLQEPIEPAQARTKPRELTPDQGKEFIQRLHQLTHLGPEKLLQLTSRTSLSIPNLRSTVQEVANRCPACAMTNAATTYRETGKRQRGDRPGVYWEVDFTEALEVVKTQIWDQIKEVYEPGAVAIPHPFQVGDQVLVRRHRTGSLEPRWKGPYLVLLTTPTAVKVDGIAARVHASHLKPAPPSVPDESWELERTDNPLKLRIRRRRSKPTK
ncbi:uncharacterized protein LOC134376867 [Cynocephalus volans]|uniref:uncharacterized protein LOC134376867 n=1 Tax=Cynocephalus volans TaxID=110931 RepID=UPI002FC64031